MKHKKSMIVIGLILIIIIGISVTVTMSSSNYQYRNDYITISAEYDNGRVYIIRKQSAISIYSEELIEHYGYDIVSEEPKLVYLKNRFIDQITYEVITKNSGVTIYNSDKYGFIVKVSDIKDKLESLTDYEIIYINEEGGVVYE